METTELPKTKCLRVLKEYSKAICLYIGPLLLINSISLYFMYQNIAIYIDIIFNLILNPVYLLFINYYLHHSKPTYTFWLNIVKLSVIAMFGNWLYFRNAKTVAMYFAKIGVRTKYSVYWIFYEDYFKAVVGLEFCFVLLILFIGLKSMDYFFGSRNSNLN